MACYANSELYNIMITSSDVMTQCYRDPGLYPNGLEAGRAFCFFDKLGFVSILLYFPNTKPHLNDFK